ncbi:MAG: MerR family transcriptional regulator, partial [Actinobacteria bacterium]|nr:MerR family transcriptional regulator [Actinomycetota bacterium]
RLRYVLLAQRDAYLPLKVIKDHLDSLDRGLTPAQSPGGSPSVQLRSVDLFAAESFAEKSDLRLSRTELLNSSALTEEQLVEIESYGLISPRGRFYGAEALSIATAVAQMSEFGIEGRHLRAFKTAADREIGLIEQIVTPLMKQNNTDSQARAEEVIKQLASLSIRLHTALVKSGLSDN